MKIWLDDIRTPPEGYTWCKTVAEAKEYLQTETVEHISFDNDLGQPEEGHHLASWIEEESYFGRIPKLTWAIHSGNSVARERIKITMERADKFWE